MFFFFQAEDGIRDTHVTGVQTCALPICIMTDIHDSCVAAAEEYGRPGDYVLGANAAGFTRVADVMIAHGIV